jgi:cytochrome P450
MRVLDGFMGTFVERAISRRAENMEIEEHANFTDSLSRFTDDRTVIRDQLFGTLVAARDTTAATLSWLFYEFAFHPHVYEKLRNEVLNTLGPDGTPTYEDLKRMNYMQNCLNEGTNYNAIFVDGSPVLRLYPAAPMISRSALVDTTLPRGGGPHGLDVFPVIADSRLTL